MKNETWLEERNEKWETVLLYEMYDEDPKDIALNKEYFFNGDLKKFLDTAYNADYYLALAFSPIQTFERFVQITKEYWEWVLMTPEILEKKTQNRTLDERIGSIYTNFTNNNCDFPDEIKKEMFFWIYGNQYDSERVFPLALGPEKWQPKIQVSKHKMAVRLLFVVDGYLFDDYYQNFQYRIDLLLGYFLSVVNSIEPEFFAVRYAKAGYYKDDEKKIKISKAGQSLVRLFFAHMEGYLTEDDFDVENDCQYESLPHRDPEREAYLREQLAQIDMPEEYYVLIDFIHKHKEDCMDPKLPWWD